MIQKLIKYTFTVFLLTLSNILIAQDDVLYSKEYFIQQSDTLSYRIMMPKNFDKTKQNPVVLFLHASGQRGNDNEVQLLNRGNLFTSEKNRDDLAWTRRKCR